MLLDPPPPGALTWIQGLLAGSMPVLLVLWRWWERVSKKLDQAAEAAEEDTRQTQALHKRQEGFDRELSRIRERLVVLEDR